jgi:hypothetical protein
MGLAPNARSWTGGLQGAAEEAKRGKGGDDLVSPDRMVTMDRRRNRTRPRLKAGI